jgi:hypothetical protein
MAASICDVRFAPESGRSSAPSQCPLWAKKQTFVPVKSSAAKGRPAPALAFPLWFVCSGDRLRLPLPAPAEQIISRVGWASLIARLMLRASGSIRASQQVCARFQPSPEKLANAPTWPLASPARGISQHFSVVGHVGMGLEVLKTKRQLLH